MLRTSWFMYTRQVSVSLRGFHSVVFQQPPHPLRSPTRRASPLSRPNHSLNPFRSIIQNTRLRLVDNSENAKKRNRLDRPYCIKLLRNTKVGKFGDIIKIAHRGKVYNAMVVSNRLPSKWLPRYDHHHIILLNDKREPVGTRIHGPVPSALRRKEGQNSKIIAMATRFI